MKINIFILSIVLLEFVFGGITSLIPQMPQWQPPQLSDPTIPTKVISTCLIIVLTELSALGIVYALGKAFSYNRLVTYSKAEFTQALANLILIALISFAFTLTNIKDIISSLDQRIADDSLKVWNYAGWTVFYNTLFSALMTLTISITVRIPIPLPVTGVFVNILLGLEEIQLTEGLAPLFDAVDRIYSFFSASWIFLAAMRVFLNLIGSNIFLILLYLGLILRVIPWGRGAGGYLIALFISFYLFFPILLSFLLSLEPFQNIELKPNTGFDNPLETILQWVRLSDAGTFIRMLLAWLEGSIYAFANFAIKYLISILLCFIMTIMLAEEIGALLGSYVPMDKVLRLFSV